MSAPSEFDMRPTERKLSCGCYVEPTVDALRPNVWRVTGVAFLCPYRHSFLDRFTSEDVERDCRCRVP